MDYNGINYFANIESLLEQRPDDHNHNIRQSSGLSNYYFGNNNCSNLTTIRQIKMKFSRILLQIRTLCGYKVCVPLTS